MSSWEPVDPVDIDPIDRDELEEEDDKWYDNSMNKLERKFEELQQFSATLETSSGKDIMLDKDKLKNDTIELLQIKYMIKLLSYLMTGEKD